MKIQALVAEILAKQNQHLFNPSFSMSFAYLCFDNEASRDRYVLWSVSAQISKKFGDSFWRRRLVPDWLCNCTVYVKG